MKLKKILRLPAKPPEPTFDSPHVQLDWLCERYIRRYEKESTKECYRRIVRAYKKFLIKENGYDERLAADSRFQLSVHFDQLILYRAERYWRSSGVTSHTLRGRIGTLRILAEFAASMKLTPTNSFPEPKRDKPLRETLKREAYDDAELELIWKTFRPVIEYANRIANGYRPTGVGSDPRGRGRCRNNAHDAGGDRLSGAKSGWAVWDNFVWYFENIMKCQPVLVSKNNFRSHEQFFRAATRYYGSVKDAWRRLGVAPLVDIDIMLPLAMKLSWETGLNTESLLNLRRDCYQESHPLTGLPCLRYYKERSTGEKDLHLTLLDAPGQNDLPLLPKQSLIIKRTIDLIKKLTDPFRERAKDSDKDFLFIYQTKNPVNGKTPGEVVRFRQNTIFVWSQKLMKKWKKEGHTTMPEFVNLGRFRPTRITQMVRQGRDIFDIQAVAGHSSVSTTMRYIAERQIAPLARREVAATLRQIHENRVEFERKPKPYAKASTQGRGSVIYKGILADCKDVYSPPKVVRQLPTYGEGQSCTYFNMCLTCPNVIVTKRHLPTLIHYKREIDLAVGVNNLNQAPPGEFYEKTLAILDDIFLEFSEEDLAWAAEIAECADDLIDTITYRGVQDEEQP